MLRLGFMYIAIYVTIKFYVYTSYMLRLGFMYKVIYVKIRGYVYSYLC